MSRAWIDKNIDDFKEEIIRCGDNLFKNPETGFFEFTTRDIVSSFLNQHRIPYETDYLRTGVRIPLGVQMDAEKSDHAEQSNSVDKPYHIAVLADMDALLVPGDNGEMIPFHSCGHSIQVAVMLFAAKLLYESEEFKNCKGRVTFFTTPAEEFIEFDKREKLKQEGRIRYFSGKQNMIAEGMFDDVDCVLSCHINGDTETLFDVGSTLAGFQAKEITFLGEPAHAGFAPFAGRNALQGASLFMNALGMLKDQFNPTEGIKIYPVMKECEASLNVIPSKISMETYVRANTTAGLFDASAKFDQCATHCAQALGLECEINTIPGYLPLKQSEQLNDVILKNMLDICPEEKIVKGVLSGASGDVGDIGTLLPTVQFGFSGISGRIHSADFEITDPENVYCNTTKVLVNTILDLLEHKELQVKNPNYKSDKENYLRNWLQEKEKTL
ncbi:MAG: amidohydrolase [Lachnospiraceae bacterium]|nr:amidohydrolase [Lachnospiraceae bacterium]